VPLIARFGRREAPLNRHCKQSRHFLWWRCWRRGLENRVRQENGILGLVALWIIVGYATLAGCHRAKSPVATEADVAAAQQDAQKEVQEARTEAKKDLKNAAKLAGADSKNVAIARVTGAFDVAMANADGIHKVAVEKCMTLAPPAQLPCKDQADSDYQTAAANAKAMRVSQLSN
jgi:hypothetical protein